MNKVLRQQITSLLLDHSEPQLAQSDMEFVLKQRGTSPSDFGRELRLMEDEGLVEKLSWRPEHWRLTSPGEKASAPLPSKFMEWISTHWLALIALLISVIALIKK